MKVAILLLTTIVFHGCASIYSTVDFEILEPATITFPDKVNQIIILNRAPFTLDVIAEENREGLALDHLVAIDTAIINRALHGLQYMLKQSPLERFHTPYWFTDRRSDTTLLKDLFLTKREVTSLCETYAADAIISLEVYTTGIHDSIQFYEEYPEVIRMQYFTVYNKMTWNIYLPEYPRALDSYTFMDTLYFSYIQDGIVEPVPSGIDMIRELFYQSGLRYGSYLVPVWNRATRILFQGKGDSLKLASRYTSTGDWDQAYSIWEGLSASRDSSMASKALYNMAVFHELEDDLDSASIFVDMALGLDTLEVVRDYRDELDIRLLNRNEVIKQIK